MTVQCELCPKACVIEPGQTGECRVRMNLDGKLIALTYGFPCSIHRDPVEKKPLFHFLPGSGILSLATVGCNLRCKNCQNWEISQANPESGGASAYAFPPEQVALIARKHDCLSVAYTYTDPVVYYEYALDTAIRVREAGLRNVLVTAGYSNPAPWQELCKHVDAANIDLKAFSDKFYREICSGTLKPVLRSLELAKQAGVMVEVTNLLIPTLNDSDAMIRDLCKWVAGTLGKETPVHFSRFFPHYRMRNLPPTPPATLDRAKKLARAEGLHYVYIGNMLRPDGENTFCPKCGALLIERRRYTIRQNKLQDGTCPACGAEAYGVWK